MQYIDDEVLTELVPRLTELIKSGIGVGTKVFKTANKETDFWCSTCLKQIMTLHIEGTKCAKEKSVPETSVCLLLAYATYF